MPLPTANLRANLRIQLPTIGRRPQNDLRGQPSIAWCRSGTLRVTLQQLG